MDLSDCCAILYVYAWNSYYIKTWNGRDKSFIYVYFQPNVIQTPERRQILILLWPWLWMHINWFLGSSFQLSFWYVKEQCWMKKVENTELQRLTHFFCCNCVLLFSGPQKFCNLFSATADRGRITSWVPIWCWVHHRQDQLIWQQEDF